MHRRGSYLKKYWRATKVISDRIIIWRNCWQRIGERDLAVRWYERGMEAAKKAGDNKALGELRSAYEELIY